MRPKHLGLLMGLLCVVGLSAIACITEPAEPAEPAGETTVVAEPTDAFRYDLRIENLETRMLRLEKALNVAALEAKVTQLEQEAQWLRDCVTAGHDHELTGIVGVNDSEFTTYDHGC